jgi:hypothetical protein
MSIQRLVVLGAVILTGVLGSSGLAVQAQTSPPACPVALADTSDWVLSRNQDVGIELKHPADYREIHMDSRSDTSGVEMALWRNAVSTVEIHEPRGFWSGHRPNPSVAPCLLQMHSAVLRLHVERTVRTLWTGRDTVYFVAKGFFTPTGKPQMLVEIGAPDSTGLLEQMAILRTIRFLSER